MKSFNLDSIPDRYAVTKDGIVVPDSCIQLMAGLEITCGKTGKVKHTEELPARSLLRWFGRMLAPQFTAATSFTANDTGSVSRTFNYNLTSTFADASLTAATMNFGTGSTAPVTTDYSIQSAHTSGLVTVAVTETSTATTVDVSASVLALSTATIREIALYVKWTDNFPTQRTVCVARDVFTPGINVVVNDGMTGRYKFIMNV